MMDLSLHSLIEPEETVGTIWHGIVSGLDRPDHPDAAVSFDQVQRSASYLFRALGGAASVEILPAAPARPAARWTLQARLSGDAVSHAFGKAVAMLQRRTSADLRAMNERIVRAIDEVCSTVDPIDIMCECPSSVCATMITVTRERYDEARVDRRRRLVATEHGPSDERCVLRRYAGHWLVELDAEPAPAP